MYRKKKNVYGAIWAKYPNVAYLEGRLKSNKYGTPPPLQTVHSEGQKHTHPHASSTPLPQRDPTHLRPPPEPRALNDPVNQLPTDRATRDTAEQLKVDNQQK